MTSLALRAPIRLLRQTQTRIQTTTKTLLPTSNRTPPLSRALSTSRSSLTSWSPGPSPPRLPKEEQEIFEELQRRSTGAFSSLREEDLDLDPRSADQGLSSSSSSSSIDTDTDTAVNTSAINISSQTLQSTSQSQTQTPQQQEQEQQPQQQINISISPKQEDQALHPAVRRGAAPEFEGTINPKTGEVNGPKNEPVRWGSDADRGDWSYNGRVTDF